MDAENLALSAVTSRPNLDARVAKGAARLDAFEQEAANKGRPASNPWHECVNVADLDMECAIHGILGQLFGPRGPEDMLRRMLLGITEDGVVIGAVLMDIAPEDLGDYGFAVMKVDMDAYRRDGSEIPRDPDETQLESAALDEAWTREILRRKSL